MFFKKKLDNILENIYIPEVLRDHKAVKIRNFALHAWRITVSITPCSYNFSNSSTLHY